MDYKLFTRRWPRAGKRCPRARPSVRQLIIIAALPARLDSGWLGYEVAFRGLVQ